jgi:hypothetical protein
VRSAKGHAFAERRENPLLARHHQASNRLSIDNGDSEAASPGLDRPLSTNGGAARPTTRLSTAISSAPLFRNPHARPASLIFDTCLPSTDTPQRQRQRFARDLQQQLLLRQRQRRGHA